MTLSKYSPFGKHRPIQHYFLNTPLEIKQLSVKLTPVPLTVIIKTRHKDWKSGFLAPCWRLCFPGHNTMFSDGVENETSSIRHELQCLMSLFPDFSNNRLISYESVSPHSSQVHTHTHMPWRQALRRTRVYGGTTESKPPTNLTSKPTVTDARSIISLASTFPAFTSGFFLRPESMQSRNWTQMSVTSFVFSHYPP